MTNVTQMRKKDEITQEAALRIWGMILIVGPLLVPLNILAWKVALTWQP